MRAEPKSLRRQLLTWLLLLLIPLLLVGAVNSYFRAYHFSDLAYDRALFRAALALADQVLVVQGRVVVDLPQTALDLLEYDKDDWVYYRVTDPQGRTVTGEQNLPLPRILPGPGEHMFYEAMMGDKKLRVVLFSLPLDGTSARGNVLVQVAETQSKRAVLADEIISAIMLPQVLIVLLAAILLHYGIRRGLAPLDRLTRAIDQRSHRDLSEIPIEDAPQEVQPVLLAMNDLLRRVRESIVRQQRFTADASHQLRTPLAGIQTQAEMALRETDPARISQALAWIRGGTMRLSHLVAQLLALARVEPGAGREIYFEPVDLEKLVRDTVAEWVEGGLAKDVDLGFETRVSESRISGNRTMLQELLANLIDNAVRYSPAKGGKVTVILDREGERPRLVVEDNGPGIPPEERELIFERFHRLPDSIGEGSGLGLAIVREIALAHQAELQVTAGGDGTGTRMIVQFPAALAGV